MATPVLLSKHLTRTSIILTHINFLKITVEKIHKLTRASNVANLKLLLSLLMEHLCNKYFIFRSNPMTRSFSSSISSNDSRRMMESQVIYRAMTSQTEAEMTSQTEEEMTSQRETTPVPSAPVVAPPLPPPRTQPVILAPPRFQVPASGSPPRPQAAEG